MLPAKTSEVAATDLGALNPLPLPPPAGLPLLVVVGAGAYAAGAGALACGAGVDAAGAGALALGAGALGVCTGADGAGA